MQRKRALKQPDAAFLREVAIRHLARFATTERRLYDLLKRRVSRWAAQMSDQDIDVAALDCVITDIVKEMVRSGAVDDSSFSASRAKSLLRTGHSRRHVASWLQSRGVSQALIDEGIKEAVGVDEDIDARDYAAALVFARKKRLGPFAVAVSVTQESQMKARQRALARYARAGFTQHIAMRALTATREEADDAIYQMREI